MVLNFGTSELRKGNRGAGQRDQLHRLARLAGRVIQNPFVSVTIDVLMMRILSFRASGSDREEWRRWEGRCG